MHSRAIIFITLLTPLLCNASPKPNSVDGIVKGLGKFSCSYRVHDKSMFSQKALDPIYYGYIIRGANNLTHCIRECDNHTRCVAAAFRPVSKKNQTPTRYSTCAQVIQPGYSKQDIVTKPGTDHTVIQLIPNSCQKTVATPTPFSCKPGVITDKNGCKFKISCNEELSRPKRFRETSFHTKEECINFASKLKHGYGFTFYQGGDCFVNTAKSQMHIDKTIPRSKTETGQIILGSCPKAS